MRESSLIQTDGSGRRNKIDKRCCAWDNNGHQKDKKISKVSHHDTSEIGFMKVSFPGASDGRLLFRSVLTGVIDSVEDIPNDDDRF